MNKLEQLKSMTRVVADTGDLASIKRFQPVDATTNPTLLLKAAQQPEGLSLLKDTIDWGKSQYGTGDEFIEKCTEKFTVSVGAEITRIVPGRVSTEVDARLSFNTQAMIDKAKQLIDLYAAVGIPADRVLIKLASTWEGIRAAEVLEKSGIQCNLTLLFSFVQATACADAGVTLISPFVGRIYDWYQQRSPDQPILPQDDPGVASVRKIYQHYKQHGYATIVMGASFRNTGQIEELAGCDNLTISPGLLELLSADEGNLKRRLTPDVEPAGTPAERTDETSFRWEMNEDAMATEKLAEGIRLFSVNQVELEDLIRSLAA